MPATIEMVALCDLIPSPRNAHTHNRKQIGQIADSFRQFGFTNPVLIDETNKLIAGHGRLEAATILGLEQIPTIRITHLSEAEKRAVMLADNKIALNAGWNLDLLATELADLSTLELDFDIGITGFEVAEIDLIIGDQAVVDATEPEEAPLPDRLQPPVTRRGDLWHLGKHRVLCGDARNPADYEVLMAGDVADIGFTGPPYNVPIAGHVSGNGQVQHREFAEASGEMSSTEFEAFLT